MKKNGARYPTTVYLRPDQLKALRLLAKVSGRTMAEMIREGVDLAIARTADKAVAALDSARARP